ncbi:MAG: long-chain fatty acid--CoA ligase [Magnetococcales bacterium]|nr:long-chain fatty acid--CoA ligase [Magnetococcales bacterium]
MRKKTVNITSPWRVHTLPELFQERIRTSPDGLAYRWFDPTSATWKSATWSKMEQRVGCWQKGLEKEGLKPGDRVAILLDNSPDWVAFDQAALGLGLVVVPLYMNDNSQNIVHILKDSEASFLLVKEQQTWQQLATYAEQLPRLKRVICLLRQPQPRSAIEEAVPVESIENWLPKTSVPLRLGQGDADDLATIIYTSGTTGPPKGVMLSHKNILSNCYGALQLLPAYLEDQFLSFLPLSHALERTAGYYLPMMAGSTVAFARSIAELAEDLIQIKPTILISVPRIYERILLQAKQKQLLASPVSRWLFELTLNIGWHRFLYKQKKAPWRAGLMLWPLLDGLIASRVRGKLGGNLRAAVCGGAHLSQEVARFFIGLGIPVVQGYGLTESSPIISVNPLQKNAPETVGCPLPGLETKIGADQELLVRGPTVMLGYWNNPQATRQVIDSKGWLHTGDQARISDNHIRLTGRLKELIVLANGRKIPPCDLESALTLDPLFEQVLIIGENAPYLSALAVLDPKQWLALARQEDLDPQLLQTPSSRSDPKLQRLLLQRAAQLLSQFPGFAKVRKISVSLEPWTVENGLMTPTLKLKRGLILKYFAPQIQEMYRDHPIFPGKA